MDQNIPLKLKVIILFIFLCVSSTAYGYTIPLIWEEFPDATGYKVYVTPNYGDVSNPIDVGNVLTYNAEVDPLATPLVWTRTEAYNSQGRLAISMWTGVVIGNAELSDINYAPSATMASPLSCSEVGISWTDNYNIERLMIVDGLLTITGNVIVK